MYTHQIHIKWTKSLNTGFAKRLLGNTVWFFLEDYYILSETLIAICFQRMCVLYIVLEFV